MALSPELVHDLDSRIESLKTAWSGHQASLRGRHASYLKAFSPLFEPRIGEHDQWPEGFRPEDEGHTRSSYNIIRAGVETWTGLEAAEFPNVHWQEAYIPVPAPSMQEQENVGRQREYRANKAVEQHLATTREQVLMLQIRKSKLPRHFYRLTRKKNIYGQAWLRSLPDKKGHKFTITTDIDPSTVYPVWSNYGDSRHLDAVLVATRRSAASANDQYPGSVELDKNGITAADSGYYRPSQGYGADADRAYVWVEDYWRVDTEGSRVLNAVRVNGKIAHSEEYPGWEAVPYFVLAHEDERDNTNFSDVATLMPFQDGLNKMLSQQQDIIYRDSRPRFKFRGDADRQIEFGDDESISLDPDEDYEQVQVNINTFPTQQHGQQLTALKRIATGIPAVAEGEIQAAQNSGRALSTAWRATATRMVPRIFSASELLDSLIGFWLDRMEQYGWDSAKELYSGDRDFEWDFPNKEPRDFLEVTQDALNRLNGGLWDLKTAMENSGEDSPDERIEAVRADYMDAVLHPEKAQSQILLRRLVQQVEIEAKNAGIQQAQALASLAQPAGGAPSAGTPDQQAGAATQARTQAAQQSAPPGQPGVPAPATQAGQAGNASGAQTKWSSLSQDGGPAMNRIISQGTIPGG
jgi:Phage portal protein, SPP1 Gp6-like